MTDLKELAVGTAVQQDLLPEDSYKNNNIELFAHSIFMTKMGGDYFDYFEFAPGRLGIFFGDVAGHGIPAAVIMAMAKAVIASSSVSFSGPSDMLKKANQVLLYLRKKKLRRMMTCQCLDFDCVEGQFSIANAGHCYPAVVSKNGENVRLLKINGFPLGTKNRKDYEEHSFKLETGDTLILYTDGIIEAVNSKGKMFDYSRFETLLKSAWSEDLKTYWQRIIQANRIWSVAQDDDLTFLLLKYDGEKNA
jgi:sigma-B regulation protein RsbU (phosphoserine phosphatase)